MFSNLGNGKTWFIHKKIREDSEAGDVPVLAVNEAFSEGKVIDLLQKLKDCKKASIHINITSFLPSAVSEVTHEAVFD